MSRKLKALRVRTGMTQKELADHMQVSQQTVARWEAADGMVPAKYLRDLAVLFSVGIGSLVDSASAIVQTDGIEDFWSESDDTPYGSVTFRFSGQSKGAGGDAGSERHTYPITRNERTRLLGQLRTGRDTESTCKFLDFVALNNRFVIVNVAALDGIAFTADEVTRMPVYAHREVYRAAMAIAEMARLGEAIDEQVAKDDFPYSAQMVASVRELFAEVSEERNADAAAQWLNDLTYECLDGTKGNVRLTREVAAGIDGMFGVGHEVLPTAFLTVDTDDYYRTSMVRVGAVRRLEMPYVRYEQLLYDGDGQLQGLEDAGDTVEGESGPQSMVHPAPEEIQ